MKINDEGRNNAAYWNKRATEAEARIQPLEETIVAQSTRNVLLEARLKEAERLIVDSRPCVESWKHKHERAYKAAQRHERPCHAQWHAENVTTAKELLARIEAMCAFSADTEHKHAFVMGVCSCGERSGSYLTY